MGGEIKVVGVRRKDPDMRLLVQAVIEVARELAAEEERTGRRWQPRRRRG